MAAPLPHIREEQCPRVFPAACVMEKSGVLAFSRPELRSQPTHSCVTSGKCPALSDPAVVCLRD